MSFSPDVLCGRAGQHVPLPVAAYHCGRTLAKLRGLRVRTRDCQLSLWSGPFRTAGLSLWQFLQILGRSSRLTRASRSAEIRGAPTRSRIRISSFAGPQATQLVAQATADCPPLRSADCAPLYQASSPSRSQVTQASAQQPCVRAPPIKPPIQPATSSSAHSR